VECCSRRLPKIIILNPTENGTLVFRSRLMLCKGVGTSNVVREVGMLFVSCLFFVHNIALQYGFSVALKITMLFESCF
jgi:hypothetical protein